MAKKEKSGKKLTFGQKVQKIRNEWNRIRSASNQKEAAVIQKRKAGTITRTEEEKIRSKITMDLRKKYEADQRKRINLIKQNPHKFTAWAKRSKRNGDLYILAEQHNLITPTDLKGIPNRWD